MDLVRSRDELIALAAKGNRLKYLFFWGHTPPADGSISKACFSQWFHAPFVIDGTSYPTAEHWMMAEKARLFSDAAVLAGILSAKHPKQAKAFGREVAGFDEEIWVRERWRIVVDGNVAKFGQNPALRDFLLGTGKRILVEASPPDRVWGIGLAADDERAERPDEWRGLNLLGFALMEARDRLI